MLFTGAFNPLSSRVSKNNSMASFTFFFASSTVSPCVTHPGNEGTSTTKPPYSSSGVNRTAYSNIFDFGDILLIYLDFIITKMGGVSKTPPAITSL